MYMYDEMMVKTCNYMYMYMYILFPPKDGMTPLSSASYKGNATVVKMLLEADANTDLQDKVCQCYF